MADELAPGLIIHINTIITHLLILWSSITRLGGHFNYGALKMAVAISRQRRFFVFQYSCTWRTYFESFFSKFMSKNSSKCVKEWVSGSCIARWCLCLDTIPYVFTFHCALVFMFTYEYDYICFHLSFVLYRLFEVHLYTLFRTRFRISCLNGIRQLELFKFDSRRHQCKAKPPAYDGPLAAKELLETN